MEKRQMTNQHPITPPPELVQQWLELSPALAIAAAFQAGADQELEACEKWLVLRCYHSIPVELRADRRPNPPSLKEQALAVLDDAKLDSAHYNIILRALEQLDD
jgi:hypothetical protein